MARAPPRKKNADPAPTQYRYATRRTGSPTHATAQKRDLLWHVLYSDDAELIRDITLPAAVRAEEDSAGESEIVNYAKMCSNLNGIRTIFFVVLNVDETLRADIVCPEFCNSVWTQHGTPTPVCGLKAARFFSDLEAECIHPWMRNETVTTSYLVDSIRMLYISS
jgi:hypothetical protein